MPQTRHIQVCDGVRVATQTYGNGPIDLVFVPGFTSHVELQWADIAYARFLRRLGEFARVTIYDKRGTGLSDPVDRPPSLEEHVDDLRTVLDDVDAGRCVVLGFSNGAAIAAVFAALHPARCAGLVLCSAFARVHGNEPLLRHADEMLDHWLDRWGEGVGLQLVAPSLARSRLHRQNYALFERASMSKSMVRAVMDATRSWDVTHVLPAIEVPTLITHRRGDYVAIAAARDVARRIRGARLVELDGGDHVPYAGDSTAILEEVESFVRDVSRNPRPGRPLTSVLVTDLVGSTERAAALGDHRWRDVIATHDDLTRAAIEAHGGEPVKSTGDGWVALFDRPAPAVRAAWLITEEMRRLRFEVRAGVHVGPVERSAHGDVVGVAVHTTARVCNAASGGEVLLTDAARDRLAGTGIITADHGWSRLRGLPGRWRLHAVVGEPARLAATAASAEHAPGMAIADRARTAVGRRIPSLGRAAGRLARI